MPKGALSATEAGQTRGEHAKHTSHHDHDRAITIAEAFMLAVVTIVAAWSGYSAAK